MCEMESGLNDRLDLITFQVQKTPQKSEEMSGIIASTRISDRWATSDQSSVKVLPHIAKVEIADSQEQQKTLTEFRRCNCARILRRQTKSLWTSTWSFSWSSSATSHHLKTCQYWYPSQEVYTTKLSVSHVNLLAAMALSASIAISKEVGKFYQISPSLTLRGVVNGSSCAFTLLKDVGNFDWDRDLFHLDVTSEWNKRITLLTRSVRRLLKEGTVSPYEVNKKGRTLLHNAILRIGNTNKLDESRAHRELLYTLLDAGVAINEVDLEGKTAFDYLISSLFYYSSDRSEPNSVGVLLANKGAEMSEVFLKAGAHRFGMSAEMHSIVLLEPWQDATECGPLSLAVLRESEQDVIRILRAKPTGINELNRRNLNPLHFACCWPRGIRLLLDTGANHLVHQVDIGGGLPITYSINFQCFDAIELLINAGSAFSSPGWGGTSEEVLRILNREDRIPLFLLSIFQERRRELFKLAKLTLPTEVWADLALPTDRLLDNRAAEIQRVLIDAGIEIPKSISVPQRRGTVYHAQCLSVEQAEQLWDAGFRDIDGPNEEGYTPIMTAFSRFSFGSDGLSSGAFSPAYRQWLLDHGADPQREIDYIYNDIDKRKPVVGFTALHCIACNPYLYIGAELPLVFPHTPPVVNEHLLNMEGLLVKSDLHDDCHCACSSGGCAPFTILLKTFNDDSGYFTQDSSIPAKSRRLLLQQLESPGHPASSAPMQSKIVERVIRFETFEALQLSHTCCYFKPYRARRRYAPEEVQEIHEEWEELLSKHEDLVSEFCHKFQELGGTLTSFLKGYWQMRMDEVLKEEKLYNEEELCKLREIGVVLEEVPDETEEKSEEDFVDEDLTEEDLTDGD